MGISEGLEADSSVGTIVWVRRRNGSWWPGRILGTDELSASHLMSPRSGTPVKLLGREDASVDWYNLEKSKRVKAFRCGEFDDCIERAESSQGNPIKKREKYARREDAILHALDLEKQLLAKKQQKLGITSNFMRSKMPGTSRKELDICPPENHLESFELRDVKFMNNKSHPLSKRIDSSVEEEKMENSLYSLKGKHTKQSGWEDDNSEAIPRMRRLQDFGLRIAPSKRKLSTTVACESSGRTVSVDNCDQVLSSGGHSIKGSNHVSGDKNSLTFKRKRSHGGLAEESLVRKRDRRRPLVQVLQSSAKLPACQSLRPDSDAVSISMQGEEQMGAICRAKRSRCVYLPVESNDCLDGFPSDQMQMSPPRLGMENCCGPVPLTEKNTCSGLQDEESDSSETDSLDPEIKEDNAVLSDPTHVPEMQGPRNSVGQPGSMSNDELDGSELSGGMSPNHPHEQTSGISADMGGSKWQLKGKRNIRNLTKRPLDVLDGRIPEADKANELVHGTVYEGKQNIGRTARLRLPSQRASRRAPYHRSEDFDYSYDDDDEEEDLTDNDLRQTPVARFRNRRYPLALKTSSREKGTNNNNVTDSDEDSLGISPSVWDADRQSKAVVRGYWEETDDCFDPYVSHHGNGMKTLLVDVDLKVQASYQGERVPLVSLMSRLNGKAIIGHPIQVEVMEDGASDVLLSTNNFGEEAADDDGNAALPPVWRTGRRTAMQRIPRPHPSSTLEGEEADPQYPDLESEPPFNSLYGGHFNHKIRLMKKSFSQTHRPPAGKKFPKKLLKKVSLSSQKTRTLSSIATEQRGSGKNADFKSAIKNGDLDGCTKLDVAASSIACVPVNLVFSRILEAVGRLPSKQ